MWTSPDVLCGPRIEYSMLAQSLSQKCRKQMAKFRSRTRRRPVAHLFQSWMGKSSQRFLILALSRGVICIPGCFYCKTLLQYVAENSNASSCFTDDEKTERFCGNNSLASKLFLSDCQNSSIRKKSHSSEAFPIRDQVVEEPWLLQPPLVSGPIADIYTSNDIDSEREMLKYSDGDIQEAKVSNQSRISEDSNHKANHDMNISEPFNSLLSSHLVEEPWIFESSTSIVSSTVNIVSGFARNESDKDEGTQSAFDEQNQPNPENLLHEEENIAMTKEESLSTVILINSSICTIQRIAVLENDKLVELLLEPVKTNVQCDSVYLGVVTKLVPHMGGAFVNIGSPRQSFMDIRPNREPFVLHSFHGPMKERELSGSLFDKPGEQVHFPVNGALSNGVEEPGEEEYDQSEDEFINEELDSHENRNFDGLDVTNKNLNGGVVVHEIEQLNGGMNQLQTRSQHQDVSDKVIGTEENKWEHVKKGSKIIVQVVKEGLGTKGPTLTAYPKLKSRFWVSNIR